MNAYKYHSVVKENGTIELPKLPLPKGAKVEVIILPDEESFEMMQAAESSLKFCGLARLISLFLGKEIDPITARDIKPPFAFTCNPDIAVSY